MSSSGGLSGGDRTGSGQPVEILVEALKLRIDLLLVAAGVREPSQPDLVILAIDQAWGEDRPTVATDALPFLRQREIHRDLAAVEDPPGLAGL